MIKTKTILIVLLLLINIRSELYSVDLSLLKDKYYGDVSIEGSNFISCERILDFLALDRDDPFCYFELSMTIKKLFRIGLYKDIIIRYDIDGQYINILISLKEKKILSEIIVVGDNLPFRRSRILDMLNLRKNQLVSESDFTFAIKNLKENMESRGIDDFDISYRINEYNGSLILVLYIRDIKYRRISNITLKGATLNLERLFKSIEKDHIGKIISIRTLNDIEYSLNELLNKRGYRESRILDRSINDISPYEAELVFNIALNDRFALEITGNNRISEDTIIENIPQIIDFINDPQEPEFIKDLLQKFYKSKGYFDMHAEINVKEIKRDFYLLQIIVNEGKRYRVRGVYMKVDGEYKGDLKQFLILAPTGIFGYPRYDRIDLEKDIEAIRNIFIDEGYLDIDIDYRFVFLDAINQLLIKFEITKNQQYFIEDIIIKSDTGISENNSALFDKIKQSNIGNYYHPGIITRILDTIYHYYFTNGYIDFEAKVSEISSSDHGKVIEIDIYEGKPYTTGNIIFSGNFSLNEGIMYSNFLLEKNKPYDASLLFRLRQDLYNTGYFSNVFIEEYDYFVSLLEKDFIIHLEESRFGNAFLSLGFDTREKFRTQFEFSYLNLSGTGTDLSIGLKYSSIEERYNIRFNNKYLLRDANIILDIFTESLERNIRNERINGLYLIYSRKLWDTPFKLDMGYEYKKIRSFEKLFMSSAIGSLISTLSYDTRDNIINPSKGSFLSANLKYADKFLYSKSEFVRLFFRGSKYFPIYDHVFVLSAQSGFNFPLRGEKFVPYSERFFLGGRLTMRGFERNSVSPYRFDEPFGGNAMLLLNAEFRFDISYGLGLILFFDAGNVWERYNDYDFGDIRADAGLGISYDTPIGPIRMDIGFKLSPRPGESRGEYFFNFGHPF